MIPEAAVEAAARWLHDNDCRSALHSGLPADFECYDWRDEAKELLEAAAPQMEASALRTVADKFQARLPDGTGNGRAYNSYQVATILRSCADDIRPTP